MSIASAILVSRPFWARRSAAASWVLPVGRVSSSGTAWAARKTAMSPLSCRCSSASSSRAHPGAEETEYASAALRTSAAVVRTCARRAVR